MRKAKQFFGSIIGVMSKDQRTTAAVLLAVVVALSVGLSCLACYLSKPKRKYNPQDDYRDDLFI
jgi:hypothetical protein